MIDFITRIYTKPKQSDEDASTQTPLARALTKGDTQRASQLLDRELSSDEKARSFQLAFNQGNVAMMQMLTEVGGYKPSPEMKNDKGVSLKQWISDQARGGDEATRAMLQSVERKLDATGLGLSAKALTQVSAIQQDAGQWMSGLSGSIALPVMQQRGSSLALG